jgi:hypothetical protein
MDVVILERAVVERSRAPAVRLSALSKNRSLLEKAILRGYDGFTCDEVRARAQQAHESLAKEQHLANLALDALEALCSNLYNAVEQGYFDRLPRQ